MSMIDYGALLKINGKIVNKNEMFMDMQKSVGFTLEKLYSEKWGANIQINDNFFAYFGDSELLFCVYKCQVVIISKGKIIEHFYQGDMEYKVSHYLMVNRMTIKIKKYKDSKYHMRLWYKDNLYECIFGYGIDSSRKVYNRIKHDKDYGYDKKMVKIIDKFWEE